MLNLRRPLEGQLPAVPCDTTMRRRIEEIAALERVSMAEVLRYAVSLFLADYDSKAINFESNAYREESTQ